MTTIRDVAAAAAVSPSTVSHVINDTRYVAPDTRERVLKAITDLNYSHNRLARSLRNRSTQTFGVLVPNSANPYFAEVLLGIEDACFEAGYNIMLGNANDDPARELSYLKVLLSRQVDGMILISTGALAESLALLASHHTPVVMVDRSANMPYTDVIYTDNHVGGALATQHLIEYGHRRIACITGPSHLTPSADRVAGYHEAMRRAGLPVASGWVISGDFQSTSGFIASQTLLAHSQRPTAIFACNDLMAIGVLRAAHEAGLRVPADLSVVGYDDIALASYVVPPLTTIAQPSQQLGLEAVERLIQRVRNPNSPVTQSMLPVSLVQRESSAPIGDSP